MTPPEAVVLDFDGVIAQSMERHAEAYRRTLEPEGVVVHDRDIFLREGARSETIIADLLQKAGQSPDATQVAGLAETKQKIFRELPGQTALYDGAADLVRYLARETRLGLVTGTRLENLRRLIPDLLPHFDAVLAQDSYTHDKPHPEPYQRAAQRLRVAPEQCVAVENAIRDVQSARAAGYLQVVAVTSTLTEEDLREAGPDHIVADVLQARTLLGRLLASEP